MAIKVFGHEISTPAAAAIAGGSGLAIWFAYKQHKDAASSSANPSAIDPVTGLPYSQDDQIDPLTGLAYLAEAQEYGSVQAAEQAVAAESADDLSSAGDSGLTGSSTGVSTGSGTVTDVPTSGYSTNAQWAAAVQAGLVDIGYSAADVAAALGAYLGSLPETAAQAGIVNTALAEYGPPPVGSFTVILATTTPPVSTGNPAPPVNGTPPSSGPVTTSKPITVTPVNLHTTQVSATSVGVGWTAPTIPSGQGPLTGYTAEVYEASGASEGSSWTVPATQLYANAGGLKSKTAYHLNVWCEPAQTGGPHASVSFTTT